MDNINPFPRTNDNLNDLDVDFLDVGTIIADNIVVDNLQAGNIDLSDVVRSGVGALNQDYIITGISSDLKVKNSFLKAQNTQVEGFAYSTYVSGGNFGDNTYFNNCFTIKAFIRKDGNLESQTGGINNVVYNGSGEYRIEFDNINGITPWVFGNSFNDNGQCYCIQILKINPNDVTIQTFNIKSFQIEDTNFYISITSILL